MYKNLINKIKKTVCKIRDLIFEKLEAVFMDIEKHLNNWPLTYNEGRLETLKPNERCCHKSRELKVVWELEQQWQERLQKHHLKSKFPLFSTSLSRLRHLLGACILVTAVFLRPQSLSLLMLWFFPLIFAWLFRTLLQNAQFFHLQSASESRPPKINPFLGGLKFTLARAASPCVLWVLRWPTSLKEQGTKVFVVASGWSPSFLLTA